MKNKIKNVVCGTLLTVALALMMILTTVSTGLVSGGMNLKIAEAEEELPQQITISFDANGGSGYMSDVCGFKVGGTYIVPECTFTAPDNKVFKHWQYGDPNLSQFVPYKPGASFTLPNYPDTVVFEAVWEDREAKEMTATYYGTIIVGSTINPSEIDIVVLDQNDNDMNVGAGEVTYWYAGNQIDDPINYVFNAVGSFDITVKYEILQATMTVDVIKGPAESLTAIYNGTITKGEKLDLSKILIQEKNVNGVVIRSHYGNDANEGNRIDYRDMEMNSFDYANETFDIVGEVQIKLGKELQPESPHTYTTMTVNVVEAPVAEEPEPEPTPTPTPTPEQPEQPENPSVDQPVVEQPATEDNDGKGLNVGAILGIVFGSLAVLGLGGSLLWVFVFRK